MAITRATNIAGLGTVFDALTDGGGLSISGLSTFTDLNVTGAVEISGSVGLGTPNPNFSSFGSSTGGLEISDVNTNNALLVQSGSNEFYFANSTSENYIWGDDDAPIVIATNDLEKLRITSSGLVGINSAVPTSGLDIQRGSLAGGSIKIGADYDASTLTNSSAKLGSILGQTYNTAEEPVRLISHYSDSGIDLLQIGGGTASVNSATDIRMYVTGTQYGSAGEAFRLERNSGSGTVGVGVNTTTPGTAFNQTDWSSYDIFHVSGRQLIHNTGISSYVTTKSGMDDYAALKIRTHQSSSTNLQIATVKSGEGIGFQVTNFANNANWHIMLCPFGGNVAIGTYNDAPERLWVAGGNIGVEPGYGLKFSPSSGSVLNDYEIGTWTPKLYKSVSGTVSEVTDATYNTSFNGAWYQKVGNIVHYGGTLRLTNKGTIGASDLVLVGGFPFNAATTAIPYGEQRSAMSFGGVNGLTGATNEVLAGNPPNQGVDYAYLMFNLYTSATTTNVIGGDISNSFYITQFGGSMITD
jgi:hypothetical protein